MVSGGPRLSSTGGVPQVGTNLGLSYQPSETNHVKNTMRPNSIAPSVACWESGIELLGISDMNHSRAMAAISLKDVKKPASSKDELPY
jgi:hypothetical protein